MTNLSQRPSGADGGSGPGTAGRAGGTTAASSLREEADTLPKVPLLLLALTGFTAIVTETMPTGLLPQISADLGIEPPAVGQMVTIYALGSLLAAIPLVSLTQRLRRRPVLMTAIAGFLIFNFVTVATSSLLVIMVARFMAGVSAGLSWGLLGGYARRMVVDSLKGRAVALAMAGTPVALSIGTPLGTYLGGAIGWRGAFVAMSAVAALLLVAVSWRMPDFPGQPSDRPLRVRTVIMTPGVRPVLLAAFLWVTAHYVLYTYAALFAAQVGIPQRTDLLLAVFGFASLSGIWLAGAMVDRRLRWHVLGSLVLFALATAAMAFARQAPVLLWPAVIVWGITFGGAATSIQTAASDAAGEGVNIVSAMTTTTWNAAIALGGALGALILRLQGVKGFFWVMLALILTSLIVAVGARNYGFRSGARAGR